MARPAGFEPTTPWFVVGEAILTYCFYCCLMLPVQRIFDCFSLCFTAFEHNQPRTHYRAERVETERIVAIGCSHGRVASLGTLSIQMAKELTDVLRSHVNARLATERERLLAIVRSKPLSEILSGGK